MAKEQSRGQGWVPAMVCSAAICGQEETPSPVDVSVSHSFTYVFKIFIKDLVDTVDNEKIREYLSSSDSQSNTVDKQLKEGQGVMESHSEAMMETRWEG